jgi:hypothetical protein
MVAYPRRWDIKAIRKFMITFGLVSSVFDYLTFGVLLFLLHATPDQFRTGWFLESVASASLIVLVIRSRKPFFKSRPSRYLSTATLLVVVVTLTVGLGELRVALGVSVWRWKRRLGRARLVGASREGYVPPCDHRAEFPVGGRDHVACSPALPMPPRVWMCSKREVPLRVLKQQARSRSAAG